MATKLTLPMSEATARKLKIGDEVLLSGIMVTARDRAHKYMVETFVARQGDLAEADKNFEPTLRAMLDGGVIYHCGPIVAKDGERWRFVSAGPTTSAREEPYQAKVIEEFRVRAVLGKGGMGPKTMAGLQKTGAVYLQAIGGAGALCAMAVKEVVGVYKTEFGLPEAFWQVRVENFPAVVTMDSHGGSLHQKIEADSRAALQDILASR